MRSLALTLIFTGCFTTSLIAQDISGTIGGTILDATGSTVPKAKVSIKNTDRNQVVRTIVTDDTGSYTAPFIPVGTYSVRVEAAGFKIEERTDIVLNVSDDLRINIQLKVGSASDTVEVRADTVAVELGTPASATTIEGTQVRELGLGTRNYQQLMALMPGVASNATDELFVGNSLPGGSANTVPYAVNGARTSANNWTVDGADNVDRGSNLTLQTFPSVDAISQFKVERSLYTADSGRAGGGQVNVVTKGGTSKFHGGVYEFFRNDVLNANTWSNNANKVNLFDDANAFNNCTTNFTLTCHAKAPPVRWNDFGFTIGGPVIFPGYNKARNKTFFFYSMEWRKIINYSTFNPTLPTQGMINGNFIQPVCITVSTGGCPAGSAPVTQISPTLFNPNSVAYIKDIISKLPLPTGTTTAATTSGFFPVKNIFNSRQEIARIDHTFSQQFTIWGRLTIDDIPTTESGGLFGQSSVPGMATTQTNSPGRGVVGHAVNIITPTIINDAGFNFSQSAILTVPIGLSARANSPDINPTLAFPNPEGVVPTVAYGGSNINGAGPYTDYNRNYAWVDNLTWMKGRHMFKFGYSGNRYNKTENANSGQGTFTFSSAGVPTGTTAFQQSFANFLLGNVATFTQPSQDVTPDVWAWQHELYAQDDFKVSPRLKVYLGVRWSFFGQPTDTNGQMDNFDPASYDPAKAPKIDPNTGTVIPGTANWQTNGIIIGGKNSPYGKKIANDNYRNFAPRIGVAWDPFGTGKTSVRAGYGIYHDATLFGIYEQNIFINPPFVANVTYSNASFSNVTGGTAGVNPLGPNGTSVLTPRATQVPAQTPYTQQWSFNIQRQIPGGAVLEVGYFGSKGTHLLGVIDMNQARPGAALAAGLHTANGNTVFTTTDTPRINAVRPFQGFSAFNAIQSAFDSNYHSLQAHLRKSFRGGGLIGVAYTYSKTLTDNGSDRSNAPQNSYNWHEGEYGPAPTDRRHVLSANYVYTLPFFRTGRGILPGALGGWQLSGIIAAYTGQPSTVTTSSVDPAGLGLLAGGPASARPDQICDPNASAPHNYGGAGQGATWFNTACFAPVPQGTVRPGNAGRYTVRGPGFFNWDGSLMKNFKLTREGRWILQIRAETFNTLNWVNPSGFASTNNTATNFGQISGFRAARRMQLGAKINF
jgi:hypothetical protein